MDINFQKLIDYDYYGDSRFRKRFPKDKILDEKSIPFFRLMHTPANALFRWREIFHIFNLRPRRSGINVRLEIAGEDLVTLQDFIKNCEYLAEFSPLWRQHELSFSYKKGEGGVQSLQSLSEYELATLCFIFRKVYGANEPLGSYKNAIMILQRLIQHQLSGADAEYVREVFLNPINKAINRVKKEDFKNIVYDALWPGFNEKIPNLEKEKYSPDGLISIFFYGGYIHGGRKKDEFDQLKSEEESWQVTVWRFIDTTQTLSLLLMELAELVLLLGRGNGLKRTVEKSKDATFQSLVIK